jgi:hypothetical protein
MLREINVFCTTKANHRKLLEQMQQLAANNNTTGASIYDLGKIMQSDSLGTLNSALKAVESKNMKQMQEQRAHEQQMQQMQMQQAEKEKAMELEHEVREKEKDRRKDLLVAEIKASGYGAMQDLNQNQQSDFVDNMVKMKQTEQYQQTVDIQQQKANENKAQHTEKLNLKREEMSMKRELKEKDLQIAKENKNQYDLKPSSNEKKK